MEKIISLLDFENIAKSNNYEIFTPEEVASYYKEGLMKSMNNELSKKEKDEFTTSITFLKKAICLDENGNKVIRYFRKSQVIFDKDENGNLMKSMSGKYADTPENRKLNRVGQPYEPSEELIKSFNEIIKGRYVDNSENRRLHRVGQEYGGKNNSEGIEKEEKKNLSAKDKQKIWDSLKTINDEDVWGDAISNYYGEKALKKVDAIDNEDKRLRAKFILACNLPNNKIKECIEEVGINPEEESKYPESKTDNSSKKEEKYYRNPSEVDDYLAKEYARLHDASIGWAREKFAKMSDKNYNGWLKSFGLIKDYSKMSIREAKSEFIGEKLSITDIETGKVRNEKITDVVEGNIRGHSTIMVKVEGGGYYPIKHIGTGKEWKAWKLDILKEK